MAIEIEKKANENKPGFFESINPVVKNLSVLIVVAVLSLKFYLWRPSPDFNFSALLSVLLSFFAIWISVEFYHKATDHSRQFYDNMYKFTSDVSETLGRIHSGFGERLDSIRDQLNNQKSVLPSFHESVFEPDPNVETVRAPITGVAPNTTPNDSEKSMT